MSPDAFAARITSRFQQIQITADPAKIQQLAEYLWLMAKWNRKINLTALGVEDCSDQAVDRLLAEPVAASALVTPADTTCVDLGSGGGSPAIPLKIYAPDLELTMVEARVRKASVLREVVRSLDRQPVEIINARFETLSSQPSLQGCADIVSFRAVRADDGLWESVRVLLKPSGRVFWFGAPEGRDGLVRDLFEEQFVLKLISTDWAAGSDRLAVLRRRA